MTGNVFLVVLAAAIFVVVDDTSLMTVSILVVAGDPDTKVSSVQGAIARETLGPRPRHHIGTARRRYARCFESRPRDRRPVMETALAPSSHPRNPGR